MFKPVQGATGLLAQAVGVLDTVLYVNADLGNKLAVALGTGLGNFTYVLVSELGVVEAMKVTAADIYGLTVERAKDGSVARPFSVGAVVEYALVSEAVLDMINDRLQSLGDVNTLTFEINAPHTVVKDDTGLVTIDIKPMTITSPDGTIDVTGDGDSLGIAVKRGAFGCCDE